MSYINFHKHSYYSNVVTPDSPASNDQYLQRVLELGHTVLSSCEHGWQGNYIQVYDLAKENNLKFLFTVESYLVKDRKEKDATNAHIVLMAKNEEGRRSINDIISEAWISGYYYKPRIDFELLLSLPEESVWVTTACFKEDMIVTTEEGYKKITDVRSGDKVLTHNATWENVLYPTKRHYVGKMYSLDVEGCFDTIECTEDHEFPVVEYKFEGETYDNFISWKKAKDLKCTDRILSSINQNFTDQEFLYIGDIINEYRDNLKFNKIKYKINTDRIFIDDLFLTVLGLFVSEGNYSTRNFGLQFTFNENENNLYQIVEEFCLRYLDVKPTKRIRKENHRLDVHIPSKEMALVFRDLISSGAKNKNVPSFVRKLPPYKQMSFAKGVILGDGHKRTVKRNAKFSFEVSFATVSMDLAYGVRDIFENNGIKTYCYSTDGRTDKNGISHLKSYTMGVSSEEFMNYWIEFEKENKWYCFDWDNPETINPIRLPMFIDGKKYITKRIKNVSSYDYSGSVYCLKVQNHSSFKVDGVCVHNCVGGIWKYDDHVDIIQRLKEKFGYNFFLEAQNHNTETQKKLNAKIVDLSNRFGIKTVFGCDSHFIYPEQSIDRDDYLLSKHVVYEDESGWYMDYPDDKTAYDRFVEQGVLTKSQIKNAMENTNIFSDVEEYNSPIFNKKIKMPSIYPELSQKEKDDLFIKLVYDLWEQEKPNIEQSLWNKYEEEIKKESSIVVDTFHADYFLLNYEIIKKGKEMGGMLTQSGRGSAVSFYINKLLGFTNIDRISASKDVVMYPERFMSTTRILESGSLADIDFNCGNPEVFAQAQKLVVGEESSYPMIAFGTMKPKAAFKMYARAKNVPFDVANEISNQIGEYEKALNHVDDEAEKEFINIEDYISDEYSDIFKESEKYLGIVSDIKIAPCGYLLYSGDIRREIGLIVTKSANGKERLCCVIEGKIAEKHNFLKNDLLKVTVVELIHDTFKRIGIPILTVDQLLKTCDKNKIVWDVYANGYTVGVNQIEQDGTRGRATKYKPQNIAELSAFIAAVRPSFKSVYSIFESRQSFNYGIPSFDSVIQTEVMKDSFLLYQEQLMGALNFAGYDMSDCYSAVKNIAKKRAEKVKKLKDKFIIGFSEKVRDLDKKNKKESDELSHKIWQIISDASAYGFNASHSYSYAVDSIYTAFLKSHYPLHFYETFMNQMERDGKKDRLTKAKIEAERGYKIKFPPFRFGQDNRSIVANVEKREITSSLSSIKGFNKKIGEDLYELGQMIFPNFVDLLIFAEENDKLSKKWEDLIKLGYFETFGNNKKLFDFYIEFTVGKYRYNKTLKDKTKNERKAELIKIFESLSDERYPFADQIRFEQEILGYIQLTMPVDKKYVYVLDVNTKFSPRVQLYSIATGKQDTFKISKKYFENNPLKPGDLVYCKNFQQKPAVKYVNGEYVEDPDNKVWWINLYEIVKDIKIKEK